MVIFDSPKGKAAINKSMGISINEGAHFQNFHIYTLIFFEIKDSYVTYKLFYRQKIYKCDECEYETKYPHNLRTHLTKHLTGEEAFIHCDLCPDFKTKWELTYRNHMKIKHNVGIQEIFSCNLCEYKTRVKICLKRHLERHNKGLITAAKFKCEYPVCNYECDSKALLKVHFLIHKDDSEQKAFQCTECCYSTNSKTHILKHIKSAHNTGDDTVVSVNTKNYDESVQKKRRLNGKPLYRCIQCSFRTHYHALLLKHLVKHREGDETKVTKVWKCSKCPYATFFQNAFDEHQQTDCDKKISNELEDMDCKDEEDSLNNFVNEEKLEEDAEDKDEGEQNEEIANDDDDDENLNELEATNQEELTEVEMVLVKEEH